MKRTMTMTMAMVLLVAVVLVGCADGGGSGDDAALRVVATTTQVADIAREVGGDRVEVTTLVGPGADPHDFEPRPSDARAVAEADLVVRSGGDLDGWLSDVVEGAGGDAATLDLIDHSARREGDPHWWQDPRNVSRATEAVRDAFTEADPDGEAVYRDEAARHAGEVARLDAAIEACFEGIPAERRKLVTGHDSFGYFAARYDIEVLGSIVPALSSSAQPSAGDVRRLVDAIEREGVRTIFPESALSRRLEEAVARDAGVKVGPPLYADSLGEDGTEGDTYLGALRHDARAIAEGFGGSCDLPAP